MASISVEGATLLKTLDSLQVTHEGRSLPLHPLIFGMILTFLSRLLALADVMVGDGIDGVILDMNVGLPNAQDDGGVDDDGIGTTFTSLRLGENIGVTTLWCLDMVGNFGVWWGRWCCGAI